jgi:Protein of unknown function (DUF3313)
MMKSVARNTGILLLGAMLGAGAAANALAQEGDSGFLRDYSNLKETKDTTGKTIRAWVSPKLTPANYNAVLVDPIVFYPEPKPSERVSAKELDRMLAYSNSLLKRTLSQRFNVVNQAGPGVLRIRVAFSSVAAKGEGLKPYQYVPMAFIATMAKRAATGEPQKAFIVLEVEGTDSASGQLMAQRLRVGTGEKLKSIGEKDPITLELVKPLLDEMAGQAFPELSKYVKPK